MIDPWELMLHHSYSGAPGVIFDQSPGRKSHGTAVNLSNSDFLTDGAEAGSGAVSFRSGGVVKVQSPERWKHIGALRCEVVCICDVDGGSGALVSGDSFGLSIGSTDSTPFFSHGNIVGGGGLTPHQPVIPFGRWFTLSVTYNGLTGSEMTLDGQKFDVFDTVGEGPLGSFSNFWIGNSRDGTRPWHGRIDDVKVWRYSPHWVDDSFLNRPVNPLLQDCWRRWSKALIDALRADPECGAQVRNLIDAAITSLVQRASQSATDATWQAAVIDYQQRWPSGDFHQLQAILADLVAAIGGDLQLMSDPALVALANDPCVQQLASRLPTLDCDPGFTDLLRNTSKQIELLS